MKKWIALLLAVSISVLPVLDGTGLKPFQYAAAEEQTISVAPNLAYQNYRRWGRCVTSYLCKMDAGYMRVCETENANVRIEYYDDDFQYLSQKDISAELPIFGAFYEGSDSYYLAWGQQNPEESDETEVMRVVKYDKNWNRQAAASVKGANTYIPFDAGSFRMTEAQGYLYIRTSHEMYQSEDGYHHQSNMSYQIETENMAVVDSFYGVMNVGVGYVSHSFNQFILVDDDNKIIALDHGDAYPRAAVLGTYAQKAGADSFTGSYTHESVLEYQGDIGANDTGASIGGLAYSAGYYLTAGNSIPQDENYASHTVRNIYVTATEKGSIGTGGTAVKWITDYDDSNSFSPSTPHLLKINEDAFVLLWSQMAGAKSNATNGKISYVFLDGAGNTTSEIYTAEGELSDCSPIISGQKIVWYVSDGEKLQFYTLAMNGELDSVTLGEDGKPVQAESDISPIPSATASAEPTATTEADATPTVTASTAPTAGVSATANASAAPTAEASAEPTATAAAIPSATASTAPTATAIPSATAGTEPTAIASAEPTGNRKPIVAAVKKPGKGSVLKSSKGEKYTVLKVGAALSYTAPKNKKVTSVTVPSKVKIQGITYKVTAVNAKAFKNCKKLKKVTLGKNISSIGKNAFSRCTKLKTIRIPQNKKKVLTKLLKKSKLPKKAKIKTY